MLELFVERVLTSTFPPSTPNSTGLSPAESLRRFFEAIASGALLPGATGIHLVDPCEKDPVDALAPLTLQQREDITVSAQVILFSEKLCLYYCKQVIKLKCCIYFIRINIVMPILLNCLLLN